jgi:hypothetical protein
MPRSEQYIKNPVRKFNHEIAGYPIEKADPLLAELNTRLVEQGCASTAENIRQSIRLIRNQVAEEIADRKIQTVTITEVLKKSTPDIILNQVLTEQEKIQWRKSKLINITRDQFISANQKEKLIYEGIKYFPEGTIDLEPIAYKGIVLTAKNNEFCIFKGKPDKKSDRKYAEKILENLGFDKPENVHFHHQITNGVQQLVLISKTIHDIPHIGWSRYAKIQNLVSSSNKKSNNRF